MTLSRLTIKRDTFYSYVEKLVTKYFVWSRARAIRKILKRHKVGHIVVLRWWGYIIVKIV